MAPLLVGLMGWIRVPAVVPGILAGIAVRPSGLGWVEIDLPIQILALIALAFLLFLPGLEYPYEHVAPRSSVIPCVSPAQPTLRL